MDNYSLIKDDMPSRIELFEQQEALNNIAAETNTQLENLMLSQSLLQEQINNLLIEEQSRVYENSPLYIYAQLKNHLDTIRLTPFDSSSGFTYPLYDHLSNKTLNIAYCCEYEYERCYTNGILTHFQQFANETTGDGTLPVPDITTINIR
jgi:hypothetical protein